MGGRVVSCTRLAMSLSNFDPPPMHLPLPSSFFPPIIDLVIRWSGLMQLVARSRGPDSTRSRNRPTAAMSLLCPAPCLLFPPSPRGFTRHGFPERISKRFIVFSVCKSPARVWGRRKFLPPSSFLQVIFSFYLSSF